MYLKTSVFLLNICLNLNILLNDYIRHPPDEHQLQFWASKQAIGKLKVLDCVLFLFLSFYLINLLKNSLRDNIKINVVREVNKIDNFFYCSSQLCQLYTFSYWNTYLLCIYRVMLIVDCFYSKLFFIPFISASWLYVLYRVFKFNWFWSSKYFA